MLFNIITGGLKSILAEKERVSFLKMLRFLPVKAMKWIGR
jgi:hypothetical protein